MLALPLGLMFVGILLASIFQWKDYAVSFLPVSNERTVQRPHSFHFLQLYSSKTEKRKSWNGIAGAERIAA